MGPLATLHEAGCNVLWPTANAATAVAVGLLLQVLGAAVMVALPNLDTREWRGRLLGPATAGAFQRGHSHGL